MTRRPGSLVTAQRRSNAFHAFGVNSQHTKSFFLETTTLNDAHNPFNGSGPTKVGVAMASLSGDDIHLRQSWVSFQEALNVDQAEYETLLRPWCSQT